MQTRRGGRVWLARHDDMGRGHRRSALGCARVAGSDLGAGSAERHVVLGRPVPPGGQGGPPEATCGLARVSTADRELYHYVERAALKAAGDGLVADIAASFYGEIALDVEASLHGGITGEDESRLARVVRLPRPGSRGMREELLSADWIDDAAGDIIRGSPDVPYPGGLMCMVSPVQAMQLSAKSHDGRPRAGGIHTVVSPVVDSGSQPDRYEAIVAAKRSVLVALSMVEIGAERVGDGTMLTARYSVGTSIDPAQAAKVVSWRM